MEAKGKAFGLLKLADLFFRVPYILKIDIEGPTTGEYQSGRRGNKERQTRLNGVSRLPFFSLIHV